MAIQSNQKLTPKGTPPQPVRLRTKHKRPEYGRYLMSTAQARRDRRAAAKAKIAGRP